MSKISEANFNGVNVSYGFEVYTLDTSFNAVGAVYIFSKRIVDVSGKGIHDLLYIGQTDSLKNRIPSHEKWPSVKRGGANCICIHRDDSEDSRLKKEKDLLAVFNTPCNEQ